MPEPQRKLVAQQIIWDLALKLVELIDDILSGDVWAREQPRSAGDQR